MSTSTNIPRDPNSPDTHRAVLPEVGPMIIEHDGEDVDMVDTAKGLRPGIIDFEESEEWEPQVYEAALLAAGWRQCSQWERPNFASYLICEVVPV